MRRRIIAFHQDEESHWVADLDCGHGQHVRHDPPWQVRPWVLDAESRRERLGAALECVRCDEEARDDDTPAGLSPEEARAYRDARLLGLCRDGALEAARDAKRRDPLRGGGENRKPKETRHVE